MLALRRGDKMGSEYLLLMHDDASAPANGSAWDAYLARLRQAGVLLGGSSIGPGRSYRKHAAAAGVTAHLAGYIKVAADSAEAAAALLEGNPVYEAGGTVEIRELPRG